MTKQQQATGRTLIAASIEAERTRHREIARVATEISAAQEALSLALDALPQKTAGRTFAVTASHRMDAATRTLEASAKDAESKLEELTRLYNQGA